MLKKSFFTLFFLPWLGAYAGTMGPSCHAEGVTVPCPTSAWDVAVGGLYLHSSSALVTPAVQENVTTPSTYRFIKNGYDWGFSLEGSYYFNKGNALTIDWLNFTADHSKYYSLSAANDSQADTSTDVNIVNAVLSQQAQLGADTNVRLFAGAQFASIKNSFDDIALPTALNPRSVTPHQSQYKGAGPRIGANFSQELPHGFNAFAQGAMSALIGDGKGKLMLGTGQSVTNHHMHMVPAFDADLGLGYRVNMTNGSINVMGGWMFQQYFDAVLIYDNKSTHNFSLNGPYIRARWTSFA